MNTKEPKKLIDAYVDFHIQSDVEHPIDEFLDDLKQFLEEHQGVHMISLRITRNDHRPFEEVFTETKE